MDLRLPKASEALKKVDYSVNQIFLFLIEPLRFRSGFLLDSQVVFRGANHYWSIFSGHSPTNYYIRFNRLYVCYSSRASNQTNI